MGLDKNIWHNDFRIQIDVLTALGGLRLKRLLVFERDHGGHPAMTAGVAS